MGSNVASSANATTLCARLLGTAERILVKMDATRPSREVGPTSSFPDTATKTGGTR